ncbi:RagB/SusD family nutrient uptake outer membrane protein [Haoranjiania flava]|uniref:RagB/SusD family nutrient uptake outer membrane protein n=1 Tax=Haoranjiania flava TaxID=1856322 RepID=A0AAE3LKX6_9BACT|nr:RagB/SusD family nutrient uptake outer membrane protein [Haoranjiania flava]MCU7694784.1 RagB/SusD family nutrient uptake outer membrane protein [Haoranjiania flava]
MKKQIFYLIVLSFLFAGCKKDFLERPSKNNPTLETYYTNAEQVNGATGILYNVIWYDYIDKAFFAIGEVLSGNMWAAGSDFNSFKNFTVSGTDQAVANSWTAFYKAAGTATVLMNTFEDKKKTVSGDVSYLDQGIAESRFIRAVAYFYLTRTFGAVPIVTDPVKLSETGNFNLPRYKQQDVLKFIIEDLKFAEEHLSSTASQPGRVTSYSATGMMAKVYLYMKDYENAKKKAWEIMESKKYSLYPDYYKMFSSTTANNNQESLFALQWLAAGGYSIGNAMQVYIAPITLMNPIAGGGGYSLFIPSIDLIQSYEPGDKRREWSIMEHGFKRTDWTSDKFPNGYFIYDTTYVSSADQLTKIKTPTRSNPLKYVVGTDPGGGINAAFTSMNTYILRYADILLIYAEAVLGNSASTSDATALGAFNAVRRRAGFLPSEDKTSITIDDILHERRVEFAFEGDYWFDIQRMGFDKAKVIIGAQERGVYSSAGTHKIDHFGVTLSSPSQLFLPIPTSEVLTNPELGKDPVPYY